MMNDDYLCTITVDAILNPALHMSGSRVHFLAEILIEVPTGLLRITTEVRRDGEVLRIMVTKSIATNSAVIISYWVNDNSKIAKLKFESPPPPPLISGLLLFHTLFRWLLMFSVCSPPWKIEIIIFRIINTKCICLRDIALRRRQMHITRLSVHKTPFSTKNFKERDWFFLRKSGVKGGKWRRGREVE